MKNIPFLLALLAIVFVGCHGRHQHSDQEGQEVSHAHDEHTEAPEHEEAKFQYTAYSPDFELFAEADPFVVGETANVLSHLSTLPSFMAVDSGSITIRLIAGGKNVSQTLDKPTGKGIYSFDLKAEAAGKGLLRYEITRDNRVYEVIVPDITVYNSSEEAQKAAGQQEAISRTNTTVFTKEQSWKVAFSTAFPQREPFGQVIHTSAQVQALPGEEMIVGAGMNGMVTIHGTTALEGKEVSTGQVLFTISGSGMADNNSSVRYAEARNNLGKASADYERAKKLAVERIVSEKDLLEAKNRYDNANALFDNLKSNFNASGQKVKSPISGYVKQVFVSNGSYVESGQPIVTVSQNKTLTLQAEVQQKYASLLSSITSATIRRVDDDMTYSLEDVNGKVLSYGKAVNADNYLIPVTLQIDNTAGFVPGGFVEVYLKTLSSTQALTVPNTSLLEDQGNFFVYVQVTPELFEKREVKTGGTDGIRTEITRGVSAEERIVTRGAIFIKLAQATGTLDAHSGHVH